MQQQQTNTHLLQRRQSFAPHPEDACCIRERMQCSLVVMPGEEDKKKKKEEKKTWKNAEQSGQRQIYSETQISC